VQVLVKHIATVKVGKIAPVVVHFVVRNVLHKLAIDMLDEGALSAAFVAQHDDMSLRLILAHSNFVEKVVPQVLLWHRIL